MLKIYHLPSSKLPDGSFRHNTVTIDTDTVTDAELAAIGIKRNNLPQTDKLIELEARVKALESNPFFSP